MTETRQIDPFAGVPDADPAAIETRQGFQRVGKTVDLIGKPARRKKTDLNPMQRRWFEKHGYLYARVDKADAWAGRAKDLWGVFDYIATRADQVGTLYVQVTDKGDLSKRRRKVMAAEVTPVLLASGNKIQIHGWYQPGGPGTRWEVLIEEVTEAAQ
jgi:hypothetical protein